MRFLQPIASWLKDNSFPCCTNYDFAGASSPMSDRFSAVLTNTVSLTFLDWYRQRCFVMRLIN